MLIAPDLKLAEVTFKDGVLVNRLDPPQHPQGQ